MTRAAKRKVTRVEAAQGVLDVVTTNMERALRHVSVERGHDPRDFTLIPFGGAGGLHPLTWRAHCAFRAYYFRHRPAPLSASGVLTADVVKSKAAPDDRSERKVTANPEQIFREMEKQAHATLLNEGFPDRKQKRWAFARSQIQGQSFELQIKMLQGNIPAAFHRAHVQDMDMRRKRMRLKLSARDCDRAGL
jgi:N-methylhydantoinase A